MVDEVSQQKQQREDDVEENESIKRFKNSLSLSDVNNSYCQVKAEIGDLKFNIQELTSSVKQNTQTNTTIQGTLNSIIDTNTNVQTTLNGIMSTLANLTSQLNNLCEINKKNEKQMQDMDKRINNLEQQLLNKNIEIKNVPDEKMLPNDIVKTIASSLEVKIDDTDISNSYHPKKSQKVIVEFTSINKKKEFMGKIKRHRVESSIITGDTNNKSFVYINEQLTANKRHLLWLVKTRAKESNWKFVWVKNGNIFAKRNEISNPIIINNTVDIEMITTII